MSNRRVLPASVLLVVALAACGGPTEPSAAPPSSPAQPSDAPVGQAQSPIDLPGGSVAQGTVGDLVFHYPDPVEVELEYVHRDGDDGCAIRGREETIEAEVPEGAAWVERDGERFDLAQTHFHTPSEHTVSGEGFPMEQHLVHVSEVDPERRLVVAVFLQGGAQAPTPQDLVLAALPTECDAETPVEGIDLRAMLPQDLTTRHYEGSLTTSPFTGGVEWHVLQSPVPVLDDTVQRFQAEFPEGDAREVQPLAGRTVDLVGGSWAP